MVKRTISKELNDELKKIEERANRIKKERAERKRLKEEKSLKKIVA